jgi:stage V sporulation protein R
MIETLIDPAAAWDKPKCKDVIVSDKRDYKYPRKHKIADGHEYMHDWINTPEHMKKEEHRIKMDEIKAELSIFGQATRDIFGFLMKNAPLKPWEQDIMAMIYREGLYFSPQRPTKVSNEGFASWVDFNIMARLGMADSSGIMDYSHHKAGVLGGKYSMNPYKLGFNILLDIEERWNKGRFGDDYEKCDSYDEKRNWDKKLGLGKEKVFEVREYYNDMMLIHEFVTEDFVAKNEMFEWALLPNGEYQIVSRNAKEIKKKLLRKFMNGGLPDIHLEDPNYKGKNYLLLQHNWDGRLLKDKWIREVLPSLFFLWKRPVFLATRNKSGEEMVYVCDSDDYKKVQYVTRKELDASIR